MREQLILHSAIDNHRIRLIKDFARFGEGADETGQLLLFGTAERQAVLDLGHALVETALHVSRERQADHYVADVFEQRDETDAFVLADVVDGVVGFLDVVGLVQVVEDGLDVFGVGEAGQLEDEVAVDRDAGEVCGGLQGHVDVLGQPSSPAAC